MHFYYEFIDLFPQVLFVAHVDARSIIIDCGVWKRVKNLRNLMSFISLLFLAGEIKVSIQIAHHHLVLTRIINGTELQRLATDGDHIGKYAIPYL